LGSICKQFTNVAVHDLVIQPTAKDLIVGTHGRSLYKTNIASLQEMTEAVLAKSIHIFAINNIRKNRNWGRSWSQWRDAYTPEITIPFYVKSNQKVTVSIFNDDVKVNTLNIDATKGYNAVKFDVSFSKTGKRAFEKKNKKVTINKAKNGVYYLPKGKYTVKIGAAESEYEIK